QSQINALNQKAPGGIYYRAATSPGDRYFADINGDGVVNPDSDRVSIGNPQPKFFGGLSFDGTYKNWDFNLYFYGTYGNRYSTTTKAISRASRKEVPKAWRT